MKFIFTFILIFSQSAFAGWSEKVKSHFPKKMNSLVIGKSDREAARKSLGKPDLVRGDKEYWIIDGFKYAVELTYKNNKLETLHFNFPKKTLAMEDLKSDIDPKLLKSSPDQPHTALIYEDKEGKLEVELTSGKIESVRLR